MKKKAFEHQWDITKQLFFNFQAFSSLLCALNHFSGSGRAQVWTCPPFYNSSAHAMLVIHNWVT